MKVDIYKAVGSRTKEKRWYVVMRSGEALESLPKQIRQAASGFALEKSLEISPGEQRIALDTDETISDINQKGYHIQGVEIVFEEAVG